MTSSTETSPQRSQSTIMMAISSKMTWIQTALAGRYPHVVFGVVLVAMGIFVALPMVAMLVQTVYQSDAGWLGLDVYREVYSQPQVKSALLNTLYMVSASTVLALLLGTGLAWVITSVNVPFVRFMSIIPVLPLLLPALIGALGWQFLLAERPGLINVALRAVIPGHQETGPLNLYNIAGITWVNTLYVTPYVYLLVVTAMRQYDTSLDEAARVAGASTFQVFRQITIPLLRPALIGGGILAMVSSIGDFSVPLILGGPPQIPVLTTQIYAELKNYPQNVPGAAALSLLVIVITVLALYLQSRWLRGSGRFVTVGGRGGTHRVTTVGPLARWTLFALMILYVVLCVVAPVLAILNVSLRGYWSSDVGLEGASLDNYRDVFSDDSAVGSIQHSLWLALIGATIGMLLAFLIAYTVQRSKIRGRSILDYLVTIPIAIPGTVYGAALLYFFLDGPVVLYGTVTLLLIAYVALFMPQGFRTASAALAQTSNELEEAAMVCGSSWLGAMYRITIPLLRPALASGWIFLFILMSREVAVSVLLATSNTSVMSVTIVDMWLNGTIPTLAAFSMVVLVISIVFAAAAQLLGNRRRA